LKEASEHPETWLMEIEKELAALKGENNRLNSELEVKDWKISELENSP